MTTLNLISDIHDEIRSRAETLATAESCTGGLVAAHLTDISGSSRTFLGGIVAYSERVKIDVLRVSERSLAQHGVVSEEVALLMAQGAKHKFGSHWALSTTGYAGPTGGNAASPVGTLCVAIVGPNGAHTRRYVLKDLSREHYREKACELLLSWFHVLLKR